MIDVRNINIKRLKLSILSLILTVLTFVLFLMVMFFFKSIPFIFLIDCIITLCLLYLQAKYIVKPRYNKLVSEIIKECFKNKGINYVEPSNKDCKFMYHFYDYKYINVKDNFDFILKNKVINYQNIEITDNKILKKNVTNSFIKISFDLNQDNKSIILNFDKETEKFVNYLSYYLHKKDDSLLINGKRYVLMYENDKDYSLINLLNKPSGFHSVTVLDNRCEILLLNKKQLFSFKINKPIDENIVNLSYNFYIDSIKILNEISKLNGN